MHINVLPICSQAVRSLCGTPGGPALQGESAEILQHRPRVRRIPLVPLRRRGPSLLKGQCDER